MSSALWLGRYLHSTLLIDSGDPRNWETRGIHAFLGTPDFRPEELRQRGRDQCRQYGVQLVDGCVDSVRRENDERFNLTIASGSCYSARRVLLAIGIKDVWPDIPGLERCYGEIAHVCPDCDGFEARNSSIMVIGSGRKAIGMALALATWTRSIIVCTNGHDARFDAALQGRLDALGFPVVTTPIREIRREGDGLSAELEDGIRIECDRLFFAIAQYPADDLGVQLGCDRDDDGHIVVDDAYRTSVEHVFAAGDIIPGPQLAIAAAAGGAIAALAMHKSLLSEEFTLP